MSLNGTTFNHSNSVTAGTAGTSSATSSTDRTIAIPYITYDAQGHITGSGTHTHTLSSFPEAYLSWGGRSIASDITPIGMSISTEHNANRIAYLNGSAIQIEYTTNGGSSWTDSGYTDGEKMWLCTGGQNIAIGQSKFNYSASTALTTDHWTRITLTGQNGTTQYVYTNPRKLLINMSTALGVNCLVEYKTGVSNAVWQTFGTYTVSGWSGWNDIPLVLSTFGGGTTQTGNNWYLRFTFKISSTRTDNYKGYALICGLRLFGTNNWGSASSNNGKGPISSTGHLYSYDTDANAIFPAQVTATQFNGLATKATGDKNGADIATTYLKLAGGTMTGVLTVKGNIYEDSYSGALNMNNSNIYGINSIYTADVSDSSQEGIHFYRDTTHVDSIHAKSGVLYFTPNRPLGEAGTSYSIYHTGNKPSKTDVGLSNVENKSSATIRSEITSSNVTTALGYTPTHNISLGGHSDHDRCVIALCETSATDTGINSWSNGVLMRQRDNGLIATKIAYVTFNGAYGPAYSAHYSLLCNYENTSIEARGATEGFRACTFTYNNKKYAGLEFYQVQASIFFYTQLGGTFIPFMVRYYNTNSATVINSEINNSLVYGSSTLFRQPFTAQKVNGHTIEADVPANAKFTDTWNALSTSQAGYVSKAPNSTSQFLRGDASWANVTKDNVGLGNVENKSSATIRSEITSSNVTTALGYIPVNKAGDTMTGTLSWNSTSLPQFSGSPTYLVGI